MPVDLCKCFRFCRNLAWKMSKPRGCTIHPFFIHPNIFLIVCFPWTLWIALDVLAVPCMYVQFWCWIDVEYHQQRKIILRDCCSLSCDKPIAVVMLTSRRWRMEDVCWGLCSFGAKAPALHNARLLFTGTCYTETDSLNSKHLSYLPCHTLITN